MFGAQTVDGWKRKGNEDELSNEPISILQKTKERDIVCCDE